MTTIETTRAVNHPDDHLGPERSPRPDERRITRRRSLPTGRAVVGGLLIALAAIGVFVAWLEAREGPTTEYLVLNWPIVAGERLDPGSLRSEVMELAPSVADQAFVDPLALDGAVALVPLSEGALLQRDDVLPTRPGESPDAPPWRELSFEVSIGRALNGTLVAGERIDLIATYDAQTDPTTTVVFRDGLLLAVDRAATSTLGAGDSLTLTVALTEPDDVMFAVNAIDSATELTIVRASTGSDLDLPERFSGPEAGE